jgi:cytoskeletal protein RodZ
MARGNFGERLKRERELREVPLEEITQATRIGPRFLEALENEDWDKLPGGVFNRGFVRSIARYLGLDEESLLAEYDLAHGAHAQQLLSQKLENRIPPTPIWIPVTLVLGAILLLAALVFGGIYGWRKYLKRSAASSPVVAVAPVAAAPANSTPLPVTHAADPSTPTTAIPGETPATAQTSLDLSVSASVVTHVSVEADGILVLDADLHPGENRHFSAKTQFVVTAADSSAVLLELNGEAMPPLGAPGTSGTITLTSKNLRQASGGNSQP